MLSIEKPLDKVENILTVCTKGIHNNKDNGFKKDRILICKEHIINYTLKFEENVKMNSIYKMAEHNKVKILTEDEVIKLKEVTGEEKIKLKEVTGEEMIKLYTQSMVRGKGRKYYDKLMSMSPRGLCPLCNKRESNTLDHYLPKSKFPTLAISPTNLVPTCFDCNRAKTSGSPKSQVDQALHPYFDDIDSEDWLFARIYEENIICIEYYVKRPETWDDILYMRVCNHMKNLDLYTLYSNAAVIKIQDNKFVLKEFSGKENKEKLNEILRAKEKGCQQYANNTWKRALYREMRNNEWFLTEWICS